MKRLKKAVKILFAVLVFCLIYLFIFNWLYVPDPNTASMIRNIYKERENSLDVVYFGSSAAYSAFNPVLAYHEYGFTCYDFCSGAQPLCAVKYLIRDAEKTQDPSLYIIDLRQACFLIQDSVYIRRISSNMPFSINKIQAIRGMMQYLENPNGSDFWDYFLRYSFFHNRWSELFSAEADESELLSAETDDELDELPWFVPKRIAELSDVPSIRHGYFNDWFENTDWQDEIADESYVYVSGTRPLGETQERVLRDLCEFCTTLDTPVLFVNAPSVFWPEYYEEINSAVEIVCSYGFPYFDGIGKKDAMGVDNITDWYDGGHLNHYGSIKFTRYLSEFLEEHYALPDHRNDPAYASWETDWLELQEQERQETTLLSRMLQEIRVQELDSILCFCDTPLSSYERAELAALGINDIPEGNWAVCIRSGRLRELFHGDDSFSLAYSSEALPPPEFETVEDESAWIFCTVWNGEMGEIFREAVLRFEPEFERMSVLGEPFDAASADELLGLEDGSWSDSSALQDSAKTSDFILEGFGFYQLDEEIYADCVIALANTDCEGQTVFMEVENEEGLFRVFRMETVERTDWAEMMNRECYRFGGAGVHIPYEELPDGHYNVRLYREKYGYLFCSGKDWEVVVQKPD